MAYQLGAVLGRRIPSRDEASIRGKLPYLASSYAAKDTKAAQQANLDLQKQGLAQSSDLGQQSLGLAREQQEEQQRQAKQSETMGYANLGLSGILGGAKYGGDIANAIGLGAGGGGASIPGGAEGIAAWAGVPSATAGAPLTAAESASLAGIEEGILSGSSLGAGGSEAASLGGWGAGASAAGYAGVGAAGLLGGTLATKIGGGKSTETRAAKGALGGAAAGAATGATIGAFGGPVGAGGGAVIGGIVGAVSQIFGGGGGGGGGGSVICTKLLRLGLLPRELYEAEAAWAMQNKDAATIRGYHSWAVHVVRLMDNRPRLCKTIAAVVVPYAEYLAHRAGSKQGRFNVLGLAVDLLGSAACWCIGQFVKHDAIDPRWDRQDSERKQEVCHA